MTNEEWQTAWDRAINTRVDARLARLSPRPATRPSNRARPHALRARAVYVRAHALLGDARERLSAGDVQGYATAAVHAIGVLHEHVKREAKALNIPDAVLKHLLERN
jgi:hypothetical protein